MTTNENDTNKTLEEMDWIDWLGLIVLIIIVSCIATPFGAIAMFISANASSSNRKWIAEREAEERVELIRADELIREQVRRGY